MIHWHAYNKLHAFCIIRRAKKHWKCRNKLKTDRDTCTKLKMFIFDASISFAKENSWSVSGMVSGKSVQAGRETWKNGSGGLHLGAQDNLSKHTRESEEVGIGRPLSLFNHPSFLFVPEKRARATVQEEEKNMEMARSALPSFASTDGRTVPLQDQSPAGTQFWSF